MNGKRCFVDANVLVSTWVTDVFLTLAERGLVEPRWSQTVLDEAKRAFVRMGRGAEWADSYLGEVASAFPHAKAEVEEADLEPIDLPDPDDRHVVAAASAAGCPVIVTYNLKDFPEDRVAALGVRAVHPDEFLASVAEGDPEGFLSAVRSLTAAKGHPPRSMAEEIAGLRATRLAKVADFLEGRERKESEPAESQSEAQPAPEG